MWKHYNPKCATFSSYEYQLKGDVVAVIKPENYKKDLGYVGFVLHYHFDTVIRLSGDNVELLKLRCLIKAKEIGWNIKNLI